MWILPTSHRPEQCRDAVTALAIAGCTTPGIVFVNGKEHREAYVNSLRGFITFPPQWTWRYENENSGALGALNKIFTEFPDEPFYGFLGDDEFMETLNWDKKLIKAAGNWDIAHGNDGVNRGERAQGGLCIGGRLARAVGYLAIPECWHNFGLDDLWEAVARAGACRRHYLPNVRIDHRHPLHGKGMNDACYELGASRYAIDQQHFFHWLRYKSKDVVKRIKEAKA